MVGSFSIYVKEKETEILPGLKCRTLNDLRGKRLFQ